VDVRHVEQNVQLRLCYNNDNVIVKSIVRLYAIHWSEEDTAIFADYSIWFEIIF
jgi:hypothetical protein